MIYLQLIVGSEEVWGDGTTLGYEGQIEIESFSWKIGVKHKYEQNEWRTEVRPKSISLEKLVDSATANLCKHLSATDEKGKFTTATTCLPIS